MSATMAISITKPAVPQSSPVAALTVLLPLLSFLRPAIESLVTPVLGSLFAPAPAHAPAADSAMLPSVVVHIPTPVLDVPSVTPQGTSAASIGFAVGSMAVAALSSFLVLRGASSRSNPAAGLSTTSNGHPASTPPPSDPDSPDGSNHGPANDPASPNKNPGTPSVGGSPPPPPPPGGGPDGNGDDNKGDNRKDGYMTWETLIMAIFYLFLAYKVFVSYPAVVSKLLEWYGPRFVRQHTAAFSGSRILKLGLRRFGGALRWVKAIVGAALRCVGAMVKMGFYGVRAVISSTLRLAKFTLGSTFRGVCTGLGMISRCAKTSTRLAFCFTRSVLRVTVRFMVSVLRAAIRLAISSLRVAAKVMSDLPELTAHLADVLLYAPIYVIKAILRIDLRPVSALLWVVFGHLVAIGRAAVFFAVSILRRVFCGLVSVFCPVFAGPGLLARMKMVLGWSVAGSLAVVTDARIGEMIKEVLEMAEERMQTFYLANMQKATPATTEKCTETVAIDDEKVDVEVEDVVIPPSPQVLEEVPAPIVMEEVKPEVKETVEEPVEETIAVEVPVLPIQTTPAADIEVDDVPEVVVEVESPKSDKSVADQSITSSIPELSLDRFSWADEEFDDDVLIPLFGAPGQVIPSPCSPILDVPVLVDSTQAVESEGNEEDGSWTVVERKKKKNTRGLTKGNEPLKASNAYSLLTSESIEDDSDEDY